MAINPSFYTQGLGGSASDVITLGLGILNLTLEERVAILEAAMAALDPQTFADAVWAKVLSTDTAASELLKIRKHIANKAVIANDDLSVAIYEDDGTTILQTSTISADKRVRTPV